MTTGTGSQGGLIAVVEVSPDALASQGGLIAVASVDPGVKATQGGMLVVAAVQPTNPVSQAGLIVIADNRPCSSRRCSLWQIDRRDGVTLRFTSHDEDVPFGDQTWKTCGSLSESAAEQASDQNAVGNVELMGILDSDDITEEDVYSGRYDDAYIQVWRVSWDDPTDKIERIAAGWAGKVSNGESGFKCEVLGPGARLLQRPLLETIQPGCRFKYGDSRCTFDREAIAITGAVVQAPSRQYMYAAVVDPGGTAQWARGTVRWTYGRNAGEDCEIREINFASGLIIFEIQPGFQPEAGDDFLLLPGCDHTATQCKLYDNFINFGGFPHVPGSDALKQTPDAKSG